MVRYRTFLYIFMYFVHQIVRFVKYRYLYKPKLKRLKNRVVYYIQQQGLQMYVPYIRFAERVFELGTEYRGHSNIYIYEYELIYLN